jgi:hypothetical protein
MTKKHLVLVLVVLVALFAYVRYFTDWFTPDSIQIVHTLRAPMQSKRMRTRSAAENPNVNTVAFSLNGKFALTEVKVVSVTELATNKYAHAIWHLVSESNSVPTKGFAYGMSIQGMRPKVAGVRAEPLEPNVPYRLILTAGDVKGEYDFKTTERAHASQ